MKTEPIHFAFRLEPTVKNWLQKLAALKRVSMAETIRHIIYDRYDADKKKKGRVL